jgi:hypothetical protein
MSDEASTPRRGRPGSRGVDGPGAPRTRSAIEDALPLFPDEKRIARALLGAGRESEWRATAQVLERHGLPLIDPLMGGRFWPAVVAFFYRRAGLDSNGPGPEFTYVPVPRPERSTRTSSGKRPGRPPQGAK